MSGGRTLAAYLVAASVAVPLSGQRTVTGVVFDELGRAPLEGAWVVVIEPGSWTRLGRARTDANGRFALAVDRAEVTLQAGLSGYADSAPVRVDLSERSTDEVVIALRTLDEAAIEVALAARDAESTETARILGRVIDRDTGEPVVGALVSLGPDGARTISGGEGTFIFREVPPGMALLQASHLAYGEQSRAIQVSGGSAYEVTVRLATEAIELEGIDVSVRGQSWARRMDEVWARMNRGMGGRYILPEELEARGGQPLNSVLTSVPSLQIRSVIGAGGQPDPWNQRIFLRSSCKAALWIDGIEVFNPGEDTSDPTPPPLQDFLRISTVDVAVIEVYPGAASLPPEFARPGTKCAVVVWTKR